MRKLALLIFLCVASPAFAGWFSNSPGGSGGGGGGTGCVPAGGSATTNIIVYGTAGACAPDTFANLSSGLLTLGASGTLGSINLGNATSGTITLQPVTGAISGTVLIPSGGGTLAFAATTLAGYGITNGATNGANSNITSLTGLTTPLSVAQGGTGTATPGLVAGTNVTITGSWPNQTVNSSGGGGTPANPTATAGPAAVNGSATTYMRSDAAPAVQKASNAQFGLVEGDGSTICIASGIGSICVADTVHTVSATTANIGGQDDYSGSSLTATLATLASGQTLSVTNQNASALTLALGGQTVVGLPLATTLHNGGFYNFSFNSASTLSGIGFPGFGTITTGALMKFIDGTGAAAAGDLSGDATTSGSLVVTIGRASSSVFGLAKVDGTTITASGGVLSAVGGVATSITPGTTTIVGATAPCLIENSTSTAMACPAVTAGNVTALGVSTGSAGAPVLFNGAGGTPTSMTGTNITGIPNAAVAAAPLPSPGSGATLVAPRSYYICTTTCTVTPPVPAAGYEFCVQNDVGVSTVITMAAIGSSARYGKTDQSAYGTAGTGTFISGGAAGDKICLLGRDSTHYVTASFNGSWTAN